MIHFINMIKKIIMVQKFITASELIKLFNGTQYEYTWIYAHGIDEGLDDDEKFKQYLKEIFIKSNGYGFNIVNEQNINFKK